MYLTAWWGARHQLLLVEAFRVCGSGLEPLSFHLLLFRRQPRNLNLKQSCFRSSGVTPPPSIFTYFCPRKKKALCPSTTPLCSSPILLPLQNFPAPPLTKLRAASCAHCIHSNPIPNQFSRYQESWRSIPASIISLSVIFRSHTTFCSTHTQPTSTFVHLAKAAKAVATEENAARRGSRERRSRREGKMSGAGLETLVEDLIPEIAYSGEKGGFFFSLFPPFPPPLYSLGFPAGWMLFAGPE